MYSMLQTRIEVLIDMLENRKQLPAFMHNSGMYRPEIVKILKEWQNQASNEFSTARMRSEFVRQRRMEKIKF